MKAPKQPGHKPEAERLESELMRRRCEERDPAPLFAEARKFDLRVHVEWLDELPRHDKLTMLRGYLTQLRNCCEAGKPITVEALATAERVARELTDTAL
jgi:hypothetical protein